MATTLSSILEDPLKLLEELNKPSKAQHLALIHHLVRWLDSNPDHPARAHLLDQLSLELPPKLIHLAYATPPPKDDLEAADWAQHPVLDCLSFMCEHGNPKEVFMAITQTLSMLHHPPEEAQDILDPDDDSIDYCEDDQHQWQVMSSGLAEALIEPLSVVLKRILASSKKPLPFFQTYSRTIFAILDAFRPKALTLAVFIHHTSAILQLAPSIRPHLELFLLVATCMLFAHPGEVLPLGRTCFVTRFSRLKPSLDRIVAREAGGVRDLDEEECACMFKTLYALLSPQTLALHVSREDKETCEVLAGAIVDEDELGDLARKGAFLIYTVGRSKQWIDLNEQIDADPIILEVLESPCPTLVHTGLYVLLSNPQAHMDQKTVEHLARLAAGFRSPEFRFLIFRTMVLLIDQMEPTQEFETLIHLFNKPNITPSHARPKLEKALVNLLKERMARVPRSDSRLWSPEVFTSLPGLLDGSGEGVEGLEVVVEKINFVYFLIRADLKNQTGVQSKEMRIRIKQDLVGPAEQALKTLGDENEDEDPELRVVLRSLKFGLELLQGLDNCIDSGPF